MYATAEFPVGRNRYKWEDRIVDWERITEIKNTSPMLSEQRGFYLKQFILKCFLRFFTLNGNSLHSRAIRSYIYALYFAENSHSSVLSLSSSNHVCIL